MEELRTQAGGTIRVVGTAGHVDHGKSSLVLALTGRDPDRFAEEKRRGLTIDLGFAWMRAENGTEVAFVDVPGHQRFIHNMLAGVGDLDGSVFVVAANEGWMPQTEEHLRILQLLGGDQGVIALTKVDLVDADVAAVARLEIEEHIAGSGFACAPIVPVAAPAGAGVEDLRSAIAAHLAQRPRRVDGGRPRLWVDRSFSLRGPGTVVTGTLGGGTISVDDEVVVEPGGHRTRVRSIQTHEIDREVAYPGSRVALNLAGIRTSDVPRGSAVVRRDLWLTTAVVDVSIEVLAGAPARIAARGAHVIYIGTSETEATIHAQAGGIGPSSSGLARLRLRHRLPIQPGDRFVVRDSGRSVTVGGGVVLDVAPPRRTLARRADELARRSAAITADDRADLARARIDEGAALGATLPAELGLPPDFASPAGAVDLGGTFVSERAYADAAAAVTEAVAKHHAAYPLEPGLARAAALSAAGMAGVVGRMVSTGSLNADGSALALPGHVIELSGANADQADALIALLVARGFAPPPAGSLAVAPAVLATCVRAGSVVMAGPFAYAATEVVRAAGLVRAAAEAASGGITVGRIRELLGITRKHAVPLAQALDEAGFTQRRGDLRVCGPRSP